MGMMNSPMGELLGETENHTGGDGCDSARAIFVVERLCVDDAKTHTL